MSQKTDRELIESSEFVWIGNGIPDAVESTHFQVVRDDKYKLYCTHGDYLAEPSYNSDGMLIGLEINNRFSRLDDLVVIKATEDNGTQHRLRY